MTILGTPAVRVSNCPVPLHVADPYNIRWRLSCKVAAQTTFLSSNMAVPYSDITHVPMSKMQCGLHLIESQQLGTAKADQLLHEFYSGVKDDGQDPHLAKMEKLKYVVTTYLCLRTSTLL